MSVPLKLKILLSVLRDDEGRCQPKSTSDLMQKKKKLDTFAVLESKFIVSYCQLL